MTTWLHRQRLAAVIAALRSAEAQTVLDLGCGDGALLTRLMLDPTIRRIVGIDVSAEALRRLRQQLRDAPEAMREKVELIHGSVVAPNPALLGFDAAALVEVIEHVEPDRLSVLEAAVFHRLAPTHVIVTTPNREYNRLLGVPGHRFRDPGHRFEWDRARFRSWAGGVSRRNGYEVNVADVAGAHPALGGPTQMAVFRRDSDTPGKPAPAVPPGDA